MTKSKSRKTHEHLVEKHQAFVLATHELRLWTPRINSFVAKDGCIGKLHIVTEASLDKPFEHTLAIRSL
jgi:hypothetical protein